MRITKLKNREACWKLHVNHPLQKINSTLLGEYRFSARKEPKQVSYSFQTSLKVLFKEMEGGNSVILDAGCNTGSVSGELIEEGSIVYGVDVNPDAVAIANWRGLFARVCPVEKLTFVDNFFDYCIAFEILEHLYNPEEGVKELHRVLKPSGKLIGSVPQPRGMFSISSKHQWVWHQHDFTMESLRKLLTKFFKSVDIKTEQVGFGSSQSHGSHYRFYFTGVK